MSYSMEDRLNCSMGCLADVEADTCCYDQCFIEKSEIMINSQINKEKLVHAITKGGSVGIEDEKVVRNSLKTCDGILTSSKVSKYICRIPDNVFNFVQCVLRENYINCPNVTANQRCKELGNVMTACKPITTPKPTVASITKRTKATEMTTVEVSPRSSYPDTSNSSMTTSNPAANNYSKP